VTEPWAGPVTISGYASLDHAVAVDAPPAPDATVLVRERLSARWPDFGGCGPRVAMELARLGVQTALVTWLGGDEDGRRYAAHLSDLGVGTDGVTVATDARTASTWLCYATDGSASCIYDPGTAAVDVSALPATIDGPLVLTVGPAAVTEALLDAAEGPVVWSVKADADAFPPWLAERLSREAALIICSSAEEAFLDASAPRWRTRTSTVVTHGREGIEISSEQAPVPVEPVTATDTTGAGDALVAGLVASMKAGATSLREAVSSGARTAAAFLHERETARRHAERRHADG